MKELPIRCPGSGHSNILAYGRLMAGTVGILMATAAFSCTIVFAMSVLIRNDGPMYDLSTLQPMSLAMPITGMPQLSKASRLLVVSPRKDLTADAILAAYRRTLASQSDQQTDVTSSTVATNTEDHRAAFEPPAPMLAMATAATSPTDERVAKPIPIPAAKPLSEAPQVATIDQRKPSTLAEISKIDSQSADHLTDLPVQVNLGVVDDNSRSLLKRAAPAASVKSGFDWLGRGNHVAVYDISAGLVYLPDGERLEAHSGVGRMRDNPSFTHVKMLGPTPPATYALSLREETFHGVDAIRLTPVNGNAPFGRDGLLAHTYMLRRPGDSNGCVAFANYERFLKAFRNNEVNQMVVVPHLQDRLSELVSPPVRG